MKSFYVHVKTVKLSKIESISKAACFSSLLLKVGPKHASNSKLGSFATVCNIKVIFGNLLLRNNQNKD